MVSVRLVEEIRLEMPSVTMNETGPLKLLVGVPLSVPEPLSPRPSGRPLAVQEKAPEPPVAVRLAGP